MKKILKFGGPKHMLPQFGKDQDNSSFMTASQRLDLKRQLGRLPSATPPKTVIFCYHTPFIKELLKETPYKSCDGCFSKLYFLTNHPSIAIADFGKGVSTTASKMEELIAWGVEQFISIATAGTLQSKAQLGDILVCEKAVRDEGISRQYLPSAKYIHAPRRMTNKLQQELKKSEESYHIGSTWTTDRFCDQTTEDIQHYKHEGVIAVDREAAILFAIAHFYQVDLGSLLTIANPSTDLTWQSPLEEKELNRGLHKLLKVAIDAARD